MDKIWVADMEPSTRFPLYTRGNTGEVFPHVVTALTGTLIGADVGRAQLEAFQDIGFVREADRDHSLLGTGVFGGYLYSNGSIARLMGVRTPGLSAGDAEEQAFGDVEGLPAYQPQKGDRSLVASARITWSMLTFLRHPDLTELDAARASATAWLASFPPLDTCTDEQLLALVHEYPGRLADSMKRLLLMGMYAGLTRVLLDQLLERGALPVGTSNRLVAGIDDVDSAQLASEQWELARTVADDPQLAAEFDAGPDRLLERVGGTSFDAQLQAFLQRYGHRGNDEYELATPCWAMDPSPVLAAVDRLRHVPPERSPRAAMDRLSAERAAAESEVTRRLRGPLRSVALHFASISRSGSVGRERVKDILVLENLGARRLLAEVTRRAATRGGSDDPRAIFCLTIDELPGYLDNPMPFAPIIAERAAKEAWLNEREPPMWFDGQIPDPITWTLRNEVQRDAPLPGSELSGIAVSSGHAAGPARVITDPADPRGLEPGEVLVCAITDPSWTPLFLVAAAVVCDTGAMQSHAAIVARELGIPAVMSVPGITAIADGTWVDVDGDTGTIRV
jgi:pyruvate,water dikinase